MEKALQGALIRISGPDSVRFQTGLRPSLKEIIGGYYLVAAQDVEAAVAIAQDYPDL